MTNEPSFATAEEAAQYVASQTIDSAMVLSSFQMAPTFPFTLTVGDTAVTLNADGSWTGDLRAYRDAVHEMKGTGGGVGILAWLVLRAMEHDSRQW